MSRLPSSESCAGGVGYAELHCLSNFSFLRGASHPEELVARAAELGYSALALTDRNSLAGVVRAHLAAKEHGLHLLIGAEITPMDAPPLVLIAPDRAAYGRLSRLITRGRRRALNGECELYLEDITDLEEGLVAIVLVGAGDDVPLLAVPLPYGRGSDFEDRGPDTSGPRTLSIAQALNPTISELHAQLHAYRDIFGKRLYLAAELAYDQPDDIRLARLAELSQRVAIPLIAANNVHYHIPERRYLQDVLTCIREQCTLTAAGTRLFPNAERHLRPRDELARRYAGYEAALACTIELARQCTFTLDELRYEYPHELVPADRTSMEYLAELVWDGARQRYGDRHEGTEARRHGGAEGQRDIGTEGHRNEEIAPAGSSCLRAYVPACLPPPIQQQLERELALIAELKYEHYFLTVWDLVRFARKRGILCQGRGSAANSAVCYCLGITAVDPARIELLFERFISRERNEPPDIDVDFEHERREEVYRYIYNKYGRERAALTAEVITYRPRSAVRDVGKALGLSLDRVDALAKALDWWSEEIVPDESLRAAGLDPAERTVQMLVRLVRQLLRFPRHLSQHVGGFVITETPLCEIVPLQNAAMPERTFIEWDKDDIDALGILKVDCLALGMLTAISKCFKLLSGAAGTEGHRDIGTQEHQEMCDAGEADVSRSDCLAQGCRPGQGHLPRHAADAGYGAIRPDIADAPGGCVRAKQPCRGQRAPESSRLRSLPDNGARLSGRARNPVDHLARAGNAARRRRDHDTSPRNGSHTAGSDPQPGPQTEQLATTLSLCPPVPTSLLQIPAEDPAVYDLICRADTIGVFQIESRAQISMLPRLRPRCFYDLVIEVAIVRPGPIQGGMVHPYLRRRHGLEEITYPSEAVRGVLKKTLGVPLFQEQVMRLAVVAAGFTPGEADQLRRAMAAWRRHGQIDHFKLKLIKGMLAHGYSRQFAEQIYKQIRGFGEYGFPESHAASFALLVYASAWLKCYYPAAFCAALLNSQPLGFYTPGQLVRDAIGHGVLVLPIDVNASAWDCGLEWGERHGGTKARRHGDAEGRRDIGTEGHRRHGGTQARRHGGPAQVLPPSLCPSVPMSLCPSTPSCLRASVPACLRLGFRLIRGLSEDKVAGVLAERRSRPIRSIRQLARRADVARDTLARLAAADAFRSLGLDRRAALWEILSLDDAEPPLFAELEAEDRPVELPKMSLDETVVQDYDAIGFSLNAHPIGLLRDELNALRITPNGKLKGMSNGKPVKVAGLVTVRQRPGTARGIVFMTLEDETGVANLVIHPPIWERNKRDARGKTALIAEGHIERQGEVVHLIVRRVSDLSARLSRLSHRSRDFH